MFPIVTIVMLILACVNRDNTMLLTSGLFAIASSIGVVAGNMKGKIEQNSVENGEK